MKCINEVTAVTSRVALENITCGGMYLCENVRGTFMTNALTLVHADAHHVELNEGFCLTAQGDGSADVSL